MFSPCKKLKIINPIIASLAILRWIGAFPYVTERKSAPKSEGSTKSKGFPKSGDAPRLESAPKSGGAPKSGEKKTKFSGDSGDDVVFPQYIFVQKDIKHRVPIMLFLTWGCCIFNITYLFVIINENMLVLSTEIAALFIRDFVNFFGVLFMLTYVRWTSRRLAGLMTELQYLRTSYGVKYEWKYYKDTIFNIRTSLILFALIFGSFHFKSTIIDNKIYVSFVKITYMFCSFLAILSIWNIGTIFYSLCNIIATIYNSFRHDISADEIIDSTESNDSSIKHLTSCCCGISPAYYDTNYDTNKVCAVHTITPTTNNPNDQDNELLEKLISLQVKIHKLKYYHERLNNYFAAPNLCICLMASISTIIGIFFTTTSKNVAVVSTISCVGDFFNIIFLSLASRKHDDEVSNFKLPQYNNTL